MFGSLIMMALGRFRFGMNRPDYQTFTRTAAFRWEPANRVARRPAMHYVGPGEETVQLAGVIYPHYSGGLHQMDGMRTQAALGIPMMLVDGSGYIWRRWVITEVTETRTVFFADGAPRKIEFTISLTAYGGDRF